MPYAKKAFIPTIVVSLMLTSGISAPVLALDSMNKPINTRTEQKTVIIQNIEKVFSKQTKTFIFDDKIKVVYDRKKPHPAISILDPYVHMNQDLAQGRMFFGSDNYPNKQISEATDKVFINYVAVSAKTGTVLGYSWGSKDNVIEIARTELPPGLREGMHRMRLGEKRLFVFPKILLGYNHSLNYNIGEDDNIIFLINLVDIADKTQVPQEQLSLPGVTLAPPAEGTQQIVIPSQSSTVLPTEAKMFGLHIPWALPLDYPIKEGEYNRWQGDWPNIEFGSLRLWDTRTTWSMLEPSKNDFSWRHLDGHIANAEIRNIENITLVVGGTPSWAASGAAPGSANWIGENSAAVPREQDWVDFLTALATRYKGRIDAYQIWNEPNSPVFWQGTPEQLTRTIALAQQTIKNIDPNATIVSPGFAVSEKMSPNTTRKWWKAFADAGFPFDVAATHVYPSPVQGVEGFREMLKRSKDVMKLYGWDRRVWITEASFLQRDGDRTVSPQAVREMVAGVYLEARKDNIEKMFWYAWMPEKGSGDNHKLLTMHNGSAGAEGFKDAYNFLVNK